MSESKTDNPFDDFRALITQMPGPDDEAADATRARDMSLTKPPGALGRLEEIAEWLAAWQGRHPPRIDHPVVAVFAGNHGVVDQGVAAYPQAVTAQMVANFQAGGAAINQICSTHGIGLKVFELALELPTRDITQAAALDAAECAATMAYGMEAVAETCDLLCVGEMGIGNTTIAAALSCALFGGEAADWVGPGTGVDGDALARKVRAVDAAVDLHRAFLDDPFEVLRRLGGREFAAICGAVLAARMQRIPVFLDGYVASAAAAVLHKYDPSALDHCLAAHLSAEPAHAALLKQLGLRPVLDLGMRLGEGTGAALAASLAKTATEIHSGMATFESAGVSNRE